MLGVVAPLLPEIERRSGSSELGLGIALGAYSAPLIALSIWFGGIADRLGRRPLLLGGILLTAVGSVAIASSEALGVLLAGRVIQGVGSAASWVAALALVGDLAPAGRKGEMIGYALAANSGGAVGGPAIGGVLGGGIGFAAPFLALSGVALLTAAAGWFVLPRGGSGVRANRGGAVRVWRLAFSPAVVGATGISIAGAFAIGMLEVVVPLDLDERLGLSAVAIGGLFAGAAVLDAIAAPIAGGYGDRIGRRPVAVAGLSLLALAVLPLIVVDGLAGAAIGLGLFALGSAIAFSAAVPWLDDAFGDFDRGLAFGGLNVLYAIGYVAGPLLAGALLEIVEPNVAYGLLGALMATGAVAVALQREVQPCPGGN